MSSAKFAASLLLARERRQACVSHAVAAGIWPVVTLSLNIPGADKNPPGCGRLFGAALQSLCVRFAAHAVLQQTVDPLGPFALVAVEADASAVKRYAVWLESRHAAHRLLDLDVYDSAARQVDRAALGLAPRPCLVCDQAAVDCMRLRRHPIEQLSAKVHELLQTLAA